LLTIGEHLGSCASCRKNATSADLVRKAFSSLSTELQTTADSEPAHLSPERMAMHLDDQLDEVDRSIANDHLEHCEECREEFSELRTLNSAFNDSRFREPVPATALTPRDTHVLFSRSSIRWLPLTAAAVAAALVVGLIVIPMRKQLTQLRERVSELQQSNAALQEKNDSLSERREQPGESPAPNLNGVPVVSLNDGRAVIALQKDGSLSGLESADPTYQELVKTVLTTQRVKAPSVSDLIGKRGVLMGSSSGEAFFQIVPVGTVVETDRPVFRWSPVSGATSYSVTVQNSVSRQTISSSPLSGTEWTPPEPLERGSVYAWEVTATRNGKELTSPVPPNPPAKFKVLDLTSFRQLIHARENHRNSHLILGALYAQNGLMNEAEREFEALVGENPDSLTARKLLLSVKSHGKR
jgi:anti-sigma factor RsiW